MNKFFLCVNPLYVLPDNIAGYVYHAVSPRFFAFIRKVDMNEPHSLIAEKGKNRGFLYKPADEPFQLYFIILDRCFDKASNEKMNNAITNAIRFYCSALEQGRNEKGGYLLLKDFNRFTRDVQIVYLPQANIHLLSFSEGIMSFDDEEDVFKFLIESLEFPEKSLEHGDKNIVPPQLIMNP